MNCNLLIGEEIALKILKNGPVREKYRQFLFNDEVKVNQVLLLIKLLLVCKGCFIIWLKSNRITILFIIL